MAFAGKEFVEREVASFFDDRPLSVRLTAIKDKIRETRQSIANLKNKGNWASGSSNPDPIALDYATQLRDALEEARERLIMSVGSGRQVI